MKLKAGLQIKSAVDDARFVVVRAPSVPVELRYAGTELLGPDSPDTTATPIANTDGPGTENGKRYADQAGSIELLCLKGGAGMLTMDGVALAIKSPKRLPSSE